MRIAELYCSLQGEGLLTGTPSVFVRTSGCNLRCWFCDTPYTSWQPEGEDWSVEEIVQEVLRLAARPALPAVVWSGDQGTADVGEQATTVLSALRHVVITGGEPMLFAELIPLTERLRAAGMHLTIETAGTLLLPVACDLMSISPKLATSSPSAADAGRWAERHERTRHQPQVIRRLLAGYPYQLKFVVDTPADCALVESWLAEFPGADRSRVLLMPQGTDAAVLAATAAWLEPYCAAHGYVYCPRKHIEWYGARRRT
jgi:7-carboxy-7-deazaguanine synthase